MASYYDTSTGLFYNFDVGGNIPSITDTFVEVDATAYYDLLSQTYTDSTKTITFDAGTSGLTLSDVAPIVLSQDQLINQFKGLVYNLLDAEAISGGFASISDAATFYLSTSTTEKSKAEDFIQWRDNTLNLMNQNIFSYTADGVTLPSLSEFVEQGEYWSIDFIPTGLPAIAGGELRARTILSGTGQPSPYDGLSGDFWIDTVNNNIYGPAIWVYDRNDDGIPDLEGGEVQPAPLSVTAAINYWGDPTSLIGPTGPCCTGEQGAQGPRGNSVLNGTGQPSPTDGVSGDFWLNTTTNVLYGPAIDLGGGNMGWFGSSGVLLEGTIGPTGSQGFQGFQGFVGPTGAPGEAADKGETGSQGFQGFQGPTGAAGVAGDKGDPGSQGFQGFQGPTGGAEPVGNNNEIQYRYDSSLSANALSTIVTNQNLIPSSGYSGNFVHYTESITAYSYADAITGTDNELVIPFGVCNTFTVDNIMLNDSLTLLTITGFTQMSTGESMTLILGHTGVNGSRIEIPQGNNIWWSGGVIGGVGSTSSIYPTSIKKYDIITFFSDGYRIFGSYSLNYTQ